MSQVQILSDLEKALRSGEVDPSAALNIVNNFITPIETDTSSKLMKILYFIGGGIVFLGIAFWIGQEWSHFGAIAKILCTLGIAIAFFVSGVLLSQHKEHVTLSSVFFLISALLMPLGLGVTYDELDIKVNSYATGTQMGVILTAVFAGAYFLYKRNLLLFITLFFASCLFFILTDWIMSDSYLASDYKFDLYRLFFMGLTWMLLGHAFSNSERQGLSSWLYAFGVISVLSTGLALGDWKPNQSAFWEIIYPGLALGIVFLSTVVKSRSFLIFGSLGLGIYLCKITAEYFSDSLGWPLALILMGFAMIGIAFGAVRIRNRYLNTA